MWYLLHRLLGADVETGGTLTEERLGISHSLVFHTHSYIIKS